MRLRDIPVGILFEGFVGKNIDELNPYYSVDRQGARSRAAQKIKSMKANYPEGYKALRKGDPLHSHNIASKSLHSQLQDEEKKGYAGIKNKPAPQPMERYGRAVAIPPGPYQGTPYESQRDIRSKQWRERARDINLDKVATIGKSLKKSR